VKIIFAFCALRFALARAYSVALRERESRLLSFRPPDDLGAADDLAESLLAREGASVGVSLRSERFTLRAPSLPERTKPELGRISDVRFTVGEKLLVVRLRDSVA